MKCSLFPFIMDGSVNWISYSRPGNAPDTRALLGPRACLQAKEKEKSLVSSLAYVYSYLLFRQTHHLLRVPLWREYWV